MDAISPVPSVRARLWLRGDWFGQSRSEGQSFLWLHLDDARVLAFRLPAEVFEDDSAIGDLITQVAEDHRGHCLEVRIGEMVGQPLYAVPAVQLPNLPWGDTRQRGARDFALGLDQAILNCLADLQANSPLQWDTLRNYNRLATLEPTLRAYRLQALIRFPVLVAPLLLGASRWPDYEGGKRHSWRQHDAAVLQAIDRGRDLTGALARHYTISKGLVRAPICARMWGSTALSHRNLLKLLDGIPAHRRPTDPAEFEPAMPLFITLNLCNEDDNTEDFRHVGATALRAGLAAVCAPLDARFAPLGHAFADASDFIRAAYARAAQLGVRPRGLSHRRLELAWIATHGFQAFLTASRRWHEHLTDPGGADSDRPDDQISTQIAAILGEYRAGPALGRELRTAAELDQEGQTMHHCVGDYWSMCCNHGTRIFALTIGSERATAEYRFDLAAAQFSFGALRGPYNAEASREMAAFARAIGDALNRTACSEAHTELARSLARQQGRHWREPRRPARPLDPDSERALMAVLAHLRSTRDQKEITARRYPL